MILRGQSFIVRSDDGEEMPIRECAIDNNTSTMHGASRHQEHFFAEDDGGTMHAARFDQVEPGVFKRRSDAKLFRRP
jgi:hypothetical protein